MKRSTIVGIIIGMCIGGTGGVFAGRASGAWWIPMNPKQLQAEANDILVRTEQWGGRISRIEGKKIFMWSGDDANCTSPPIINDETCPFAEKVCPYLLKNGLQGLRLIADSYSEGKYDGMIAVDPRCHPGATPKAVQ